MRRGKYVSSLMDVNAHTGKKEEGNGESSYKVLWAYQRCNLNDNGERLLVWQHALS